MPRNPNDPFEIIDPSKPIRSKPIRIDPRLEGAQFNRHTKPVILPNSQFSPHWLQVAQQITHMTPQQRKAEGREKMNYICTQTLKALSEAEVRGKGYQKLKAELVRIRKVWG